MTLTPIAERWAADEHGPGFVLIGQPKRETASRLAEPEHYLHDGRCVTCERHSQTPPEDSEGEPSS